MEKLKGLQGTLMHAANKNAPHEKTIGEILDTLTEEQRNVVDYLIFKALETGGKAGTDEKE